MIWLLLPVSHWSIITIGAGGLLLVPCLSRVYSPRFSFVGLRGLQKSKLLNVDVRNVFEGSHPQHRWRCSYPLAFAVNKINELE